MNKKKAIIHIGGHKTGTSAIQSFCVLNAARLKNVDIIYPLELVSFIERTGGQAHHGLVNLFMDATTFWKTINLRPKSMDDSDIISCLESLPRDKNILLSSENLVWLDQDAIRSLNKMLDGYEVHVVLYARRQDDALQALYQTVVTSIGEVKKFDDYTGDVVRTIFEYDRIAQSWEEVFGAGSVTVRVYENGQLLQGDAVHDFIHTLEGILQMEIAISDWERAPGTVNRGLPAHITGLIRFNNGLVTKKWVVPLIKRISRYLYKKSRGTYEIILPSQRRKLLESFAESNANLARKYLGRENGILFHDLAINQTDQEWNEKYNRKGSNLRIFISDILSQVKIQ